MGRRRRNNSAALQTRKPRRRKVAVSVSAERISELIGDIYDCVLDPERWEPTMLAINREFSFANSALGLVPLNPGRLVVNVNAGIDPEWLAITDDDSYRVAAVDLWGGAELIQRFPLDEPVVHSEAVGAATLKGNYYYETILKQRGMIDTALIVIAREPALMGYAGFNRHVSGGKIGGAEVSGLRLLAPHFRRAVTISNLFDMKTVEAATFGAALDALAAGVLLVDEGLRIVHANAVAEAMLARGDPVSLMNGVLTLPTKAASDALADAVARAARDEMALGQRGIGIPARRRNGSPGAVHVLPLRRAEMRRGIRQSAVAALFVVPAAAPVNMPSDIVTLLYNLTPAEARVFELIGAGKTQAEAAEALGIARGTVKTHLLQVFDKTGCKRQPDLVRLAASLTSLG